MAVVVRWVGGGRGGAAAAPFQPPQLIHWAWSYRPDASHPSQAGALVHIYRGEAAVGSPPPPLRPSSSAPVAHAARGWARPCSSTCPPPPPPPPPPTHTHIQCSQQTPQTALCWWPTAAWRWGRGCTPRRGQAGPIPPFPSSPQAECPAAQPPHPPHPTPATSTHPPCRWPSWWPRSCGQSWRQCTSARRAPTRRAAAAAAAGAASGAGCQAVGNLPLPLTASPSPSHPPSSPPPPPTHPYPTPPPHHHHRHHRHTHTPPTPPSRCPTHPPPPPPHLPTCEPAGRSCGEWRGRPAPRPGFPLPQHGQPLP